MHRFVPASDTPVLVLFKSLFVVPFLIKSLVQIYSNSAKNDDMDTLVAGLVIVHEVR